MSRKKQLNTLIKVGGSIIEKGSLENLQNLGQVLYEIFLQNKNIIVLGGGGNFVETIKLLQKQIHFSDETAHWMAIYGMVQYALLLEEIIPQSKLIDVYQLKNHKRNQMFLPILDVVKFMKNTSKLEHTWNTTSDAIACEIASFLNLNRIIFVKDVDGVFVNNKVIAKIAINQLLNLDSSPLDSLTPNLLKESSFESYIINGFHPNRIKECLKGNKAICTEIIK